MASDETIVTPVDSYVLLDILTDDRVWFGWSSEALAAALDSSAALVREPLPYAAGFVAGKAFLAYRRRGGARVTPLPDFYIGAHALVAGYRLLTRDARRYRTSFPRLEVTEPGSGT